MFDTASWVHCVQIAPSVEPFYMCLVAYPVVLFVLADVHCCLVLYREMTYSECATGPCLHPFTHSDACCMPPTTSLAKKSEDVDKQ